MVVEVHHHPMIAIAVTVVEEAVEEPLGVLTIVVSNILYICSIFLLLLIFVLLLLIALMCSFGYWFASFCIMARSEGENFYTYVIINVLKRERQKIDLVVKIVS